MKIKLVFAVGVPSDFNEHKTYVFGKDNGLPWPPNKRDMEGFKHETMYTICLMGANTFKSLPGKLPKRVNMTLGNRDVTTQRGHRPDYTYDTLTAALNDAKHLYFNEIIDQDRWISVIGGLGLIKTFAKEYEVDEVIVSYIPIDKTLAEINADITLAADELRQILDNKQCYCVNEYYNVLRTEKYERKK